MDETILDRLNASVKERDSLYYLGDFCLGSSERAREYRRRIRCKNVYFVEGNHDASTCKIQEEFRWWKQLAEITVEAQRIVLCHYAMRVWLDPERIAVWVGPSQLVAEGVEVEGARNAARSALEQGEVEIRIDLSAGSGSAELYASSLSPEYVTFNAEYFT